MAANTNSLDLEAGSSQQAYAADSVSLSITGSLSIACWIRLESSPGTNVAYVIASKYIDTTDNRSYRFRYQDQADAEGLSFVFSTDGTYQSGNDKSVSWTASTATWYHIAVVYDASAPNVKFYVNGVQQGSTQSVSNSTIFNGTQRMSLGCDNSETTPASFFDGLMDEVVITSDVLTTGEITQLYQGFTTETMGLNNVAAYYQLNNAYTDLSGNSNTLTPSGSPVFSATVPFANYATAPGGFLGILI